MSKDNQYERLTKEQAVNKAEELLNETGLHEREILSQLWDRAREQLLDEIEEQVTIHGDRIHDEDIIYLQNILDWIASKKRGEE